MIQIEETVMQNIHERLNGFAGAQWIFFLASFWGIFLLTGLANARILIPILWVLILFQLSVRWIAKGKRPDVAEFAVKRLQTTGVSLALVVLSDFVIATHILYTLPPLLPRSELKDFLDVFFLETVVLYGLSGMLMFVITHMITKQKVNIQHKR